MPRLPNHAYCVRRYSAGVTVRAVRLGAVTSIKPKATTIRACAVAAARRIVVPVNRGKLVVINSLQRITGVASLSAQMQTVIVVFPSNTEAAVGGVAGFIGPVSHVDPQVIATTVIQRQSQVIIAPPKVMFM